MNLRNRHPEHAFVVQTTAPRSLYLSVHFNELSHVPAVENRITLLDEVDFLKLDCVVREDSLNLVNRSQ